MAKLAIGHKARVAELLERSRFEVLPLEGIEERILEHVPQETTLTVTASPTKGLRPTLDLVARLTDHGYDVVPHLSARLVADRRELSEIVSQLGELGVDDVFVVAGDPPEPAGEFEGAIELLEAMDALDHPFSQVGIAGYPEGHPLIDDATLQAALETKAPYATYIASQLCFDPSVTARWIDDVWERGIQLPIQVGIPGAVTRAKLLRISSRIGIGDSMRYLRKNTGVVSRFLHGGFDPDGIIDGLAATLADPEPKIKGFHIFSFNDVGDTERWRQGRIDEGR